jgi:site-specific recombinase XerC
MSTLEFPHSPCWLAVYDDFITAKRLAGHAPRTIAWYTERARPFVVYLADRPLTRSAIRRYLTTLTPRTLAPATLHGHVRAISSFCAWLVEEGQLVSNPCRKLAPQLPKRQPAHYTKPQLTAPAGGVQCTRPRDRAGVRGYGPAPRGVRAAAA